MSISLGKIHMSSWVLHTPIRILNKKNTNFFKKSEICGYQTWVLNLLPCEISWKNTRKRIRGKKTNFLCIEKHCLDGFLFGQYFLRHGYVFWYFFTKFHTEVDWETKFDISKIWYFIYFLGIFYEYFSYRGAEHPRAPVYFSMPMLLLYVTTSIVGSNICVVTCNTSFIRL
mgnify:CR=1 FL=1